MQFRSASMAAERGDHKERLADEGRWMVFGVFVVSAGMGS